MFSHGWPLFSDDWDNQMLFFLAHGSTPTTWLPSSSTSTSKTPYLLAFLTA